MKFIDKALELQYRAENAPQAAKMFEYSCKLCCERGIRLECDRCPVRFAHESIMVTRFPQWKKTTKKFET